VVVVVSSEVTATDECETVVVVVMGVVVKVELEVVAVLGTADET
jgi:hypothetical protein